MIHAMEVFDINVGAILVSSKREFGITRLQNGTVERYYCYNENQQILDHILVGDGGSVESIERL